MKFFNHLFVKANSVLNQPDLGHPYGQKDPYHRLIYDNNGVDFSDSNSHTQVVPANDLHNRFLGSGVNLNDFAKAHNIPGMAHQILKLNPGHNDSNYDGIGIPPLHVFYSGNMQKPYDKYSNYYDTDEPDDFNFYYLHNPNNNSIKFHEMANRSQNTALLPKFLKNVVPFAEKSGVSNIRTDATNSFYGNFGSKDASNYNGANTWANLGFGFNDPNHAELVRNNLSKYVNMFKNNPEAHREMSQDLGNATHPFHFLNLSRKLANNFSNEGVRMNAKNIFHNALKRGEDKGYDGVDRASFDANLRLDPNDAGYQRFQSFMKHLQH